MKAASECLASLAVHKFYEISKVHFIRNQIPILAVGRWVTAIAYLPRALGNQPRRGNCHNHNQRSIRARFVLGEPGLGGTNKRELQLFFYAGR